MADPTPRPKRRGSITRRLLREVAQGRTPVVAIGMPQYPHRSDGRWPVTFAPRSKYDPLPWVAENTVCPDIPEGMRFNGGWLETLPAPDSAADPN